MANTFLTPDVIAKQALATLYETTVMKPLIHNDLTSEFSAAKIGDTINVRKPATFVAKDFDRTKGVEPQNANEDSVPVVLDQFKDITLTVTDEDLALEIEDFDEQMLTPAMEAMAIAIDSAILDLRGDIIAEVGQDEAFPLLKPQVLLDAGRVLDDALVPNSNRFAVIGSTTKANWLNTPLLNEVGKSGNTEALRKASLGRDLFGFQAYHTNNIKHPGSNPASGTPTTEVGLAFHNSAFAFASAPLKPAPGAVSHVESYKGLSLRVSTQHDIKYKETLISIDILFGLKTLDANRAVLIKGADA